MKIIKDGHEIRGMDQWREAMPARLREHQWEEGRSAKELARAWVGRGEATVPDEVQRLLETSPEFSSVKLLEGRPEEPVRLDEFRGNTRNADLLLIGERAGEPIVISVEAKVDESFGPRIGEYLAEKEEVEGSNAPERIRSLTEAVFGKPPEAIAELRYQLLHAVAGTLIAGAESGARRVLFMIHEFPEAGNTAKLEANANDLEAFVARLGWNGKFGSGRIVGPFGVPGGGRVPAGVELFVGKAVRGE